MSSVDERIVEMRFDNQQFESGVQRSLHTLDRLKNGLNLEDSAKSLESLQTSANSFDLSGVASGVDAISNRVSALGIVGDQVIRYLTNQFIQLGEAAARTVKSLTIDQIGTGFDKYERKTKAVQTIMNATGESIESVTASLEKLGWFTDETSYGYSDMVDNIGKFTSNNIKLDSAVTSMIGIANAAGLAGSSVSDAAHAMEGFSKAMGRGSMDSRSWNWIQTAHMDTAQFKQTLIDAAVEVGTLDKVMSKDGQTYEYFVHGNKKAAVSIADFQNELSKGWLDVDAMTLALHQFGGATEEVYKIFQEHDGEMLTSEIISKYGSSLDKLGIKAFKASQEARTFTDAIDSVKEAVSTGWASSFEYIFGNKEEAVALWSEVAEELYNIFAEPGNHRNELLKSWYEAGGRDDLLAGIRNVWEGIKVISETAKEAFADLFPSLTGEKLVGLTKKIKNFTKAFKDNFIVANYRTDEDSFWNQLLDTGSHGFGYLKSNEELVNSNLQKLKDAFGGLVSIIDLAKVSFKAFGKIISPLANAFKLNTTSLLDFAASLGSGITSVVQAITSSNLLSAVVTKLQSIIEFAVQSIVHAGSLIKQVFGSIDMPELFAGMINSFSKFGMALNNKIFPLVSWIRQIFNIESISKYIGVLLSLFQRFATKINYKKISSGLNSVFQSFKTFVAKINLKSIVPTLRSFWSSIFGDKDALTVSAFKISDLTSVFMNFQQTLSNLFKGINVGSFWSSIVQSVRDAKNKIMPTLDSIGEALANVDWGKATAIMLALAAIPVILQIGSAFSSASKLFKGASAFLTDTLGVIKKFGGIPDKIGQTFDALTKAIENRFKPKIIQLAEAAIGFAAAVLILAGALKLISTISKTDLINSGVAIGALAVGLTFLVSVLGLLASKGKFDKFNQVAIGLFSLAGSISILVASLFLLRKIDVPDLELGVEILLGLMLAMTAFATIFASAQPKLAGSGKFFLTFSASILILVGAIKLLSTIRNLDLSGSLASIGILITIMASFAVLKNLSKKSFGLGPGLLSMTVSLLIIMQFLNLLGEEKVNGMIERAKRNIGLIGIIFASLVGLTLLTHAGSKNSLRTGVSVLALSASLLLIYSAIKKLGKLKIATIIKGTFALGSILTSFAIFGQILTSGKGQPAKVSGAILAMSASLMLVYLAVKKLGGLDVATLAKGLTSVILLLFEFGRTMNRSSKNIKAAPIVAMTMALTALMAGVAVLTLYDPLDLIKSVVSLGALMLALGFALKLAGNAEFDKNSIIIFGEALLAFVGAVASMYILKDIPWPQLLGTCGAISAVLIALGFSMAALNISGKDLTWPGIAKNATVLAGGLIAVAIIGYILSSMVRSDIPWQSMASFGGTITAVLIGVVAAMRLVQHVDAGAALGPLAELIGFIAVLSLVLGALSWLANEAGFDDSNVMQIQRIGAMIGGFIGGIIGGFVGGTGLGMSIALPEIATNLSNFITNLQPFIDGVGNLDDSFGAKLDSLGKGLMKIGSAEVKDGWANLLNSIAGGDGTSPDMVKNMKNLGEGLAAFNNSFSGVDSESLSTNMDTLVTMLTVMRKVPKTRKDNWVGNVLDWFSESFGGKTDYSKFSTAMSDMGAALGTFADSTKNVNAEKMQPAVTAFGDIMSMFGKIPKTGPLIDFFSGKTEWSTISTGLSEFGTALTSFSDTVKTNPPDYDAIQKSIKPAEALNDLLQKIPGISVFDTLFDGVTSWSTISTGLVEFGEALVGYSTAVKGEVFDADAITSSASAAEALASLEGKIPTAGSWWQDTFSGNVSWSTISQGLEDFGTALKGYSDAVGGGQLDIESMDGASTAAQKVVDACLLFRDSGMTKGEIGILGTGLEEFGGHLKGMSDMMVQFDTAAIDTVLEALQKLADAKTTYESLGGDLAETIVSKFQLGLNTESASAIVGNFIGVVSDGFTQASTSVTASGENFVIVFCKGITDKKFLANNAGSEVGTEAVSGASIAVSNMEGIGWSAVSGLVKGISDKTSNAYDAGLKLGQAAAAGVKSGLDINSPSRVMMQLGEFAGQGLGMGLASMSSYVSDSASQMAEGSILSVSSVFDKIDAALSGDIDYSPVITPVLDLSAISYGASQIDGILNQDASLRMAGQIQTTQAKQDIAQFLALGNAILKEIQNGRDLYFDDGAFAGRINRRLGSL